MNYKDKLIKQLSAKNGCLTRTDVLHIKRYYAKTNEAMATYLKELKIPDKDIKKIIGDMKSYE